MSLSMVALAPEQVRYDVGAVSGPGPSPGIVLEPVRVGQWPVNVTRP
ncbi:hypothetical protein [Kitasatospora sp. NPDC087314]